MFFVRLRISQRRKKTEAWNFACMFDYYPDRSSLILVKFGSRGVTAAVLLPGCTCPTHWSRTTAPGEARWDSELGAVARWGSRNWERRRCVRPYGGICVLPACWCTCSYVVCFCCVRFSFISTTPRDWLGRTSPKCPVLCRVGRKTLTQSIKSDRVRSYHFILKMYENYSLKIDEFIYSKASSCNPMLPQ